MLAEDYQHLTKVMGRIFFAIIVGGLMVVITGVMTISPDTVGLVDGWKNLNQQENDIGLAPFCGSSILACII